MKIAALLVLLAASVCQADLTVIVSNVSVEVGEDAVVPCSYASASGNMPRFTWSLKWKNGSKQRLYVFDKETPTDSYADKGAPARTPALTVNNEGSLVISQTTLEDNKLYATLNCEVSLGSDGLQAKDVSFLAAVLPKEDPTLRINDYDPDKSGFEVTETSVNLGFCRTSKSYPAAVITFYKNGALLPITDVLEDLGPDFFDDSSTTETGDGLSVTTNKDLMKNVEISDHQADYICNVKTVYGDKVYEKNYTMPKFNVNYQTRMASFDDSPVAYLGKTITLKCSADGFPAPTISIDDQEGAVLEVDVTQGLDGKGYVCKAYNNIMQQADPVSSEPYNMNVLSLSQPSLTGASINNSMVVFRLGSAISIDCSSEGNPTPSVSWYKGDDMVSAFGKLAVSSASLDDTGDYSCRASNGHDNLAKSTPLHIEVKGISIVGDAEEEVVGKQDEKVTLECIVKANPAPKFTWTGDEQGVPMSSETYEYSSQLEVGPLSPELSKKEYTCTATGDDGTMITKKFTLPEIAAGSSSTAIIIVILVLILVVAVVLAVLYNKGIICKKSEEKGDESAEGDLEGGMNNDEDLEGNGKATQPEDNEDQPAVNNPEEEKLMPEGEED